MRALLLAGVVAFGWMGTTQAAVIASNSFATGTEGWTNGELDMVGAVSALTYDVTRQVVTTADNYINNAFIAPAIYLGDQSGAFGGTISFDLADSSNEGSSYSPLALISGSTVLYAQPAPQPSTSQNALTSYSLTLTGANFYIGSPFVSNGRPGVTDVQLLAVLGSLDRLAIQADWHIGDDFATLDNVVLASPAAAAVPEPMSLALLGMGVAGIAAARRRRAA